MSPSARSARLAAPVSTGPAEKRSVRPPAEPPAGEPSEPSPGKAGGRSGRAAGHPRRTAEPGAEAVERGRGGERSGREGRPDHEETPRDGGEIGAEDRHEHERHQQGGAQGGEEGDGQVLHELADDAGPEQQRGERGEGGRGGRDDRPAHPPGREHVGVPGELAFAHLPVGVLGDDDGSVHQHAHGEDEREQHDDVDGEPEGGQHQDPGEEGARDRDPDEKPERSPRAATTMIITRRIALVTLFSRSLSMVRMSSDRSCENRTSTPGGQWTRSASTARRTALVVSMMFSPVRFETSRLSAGLPLTRAMVAWSLNVRRTEATSRTMIALSPETRSGMFSRSDRDSKIPGTCTANRPGRYRAARPRRGCSTATPSGAPAPRRSRSSP